MTKAYSYIRFSTKEQLKGDSLRRQTEASDKYVKENGLTLDTELNMFDSGLSAYKGKHITHGALGGFLKLIENGKIAKDSVLLIENIDRLTRLKPMDALGEISKIINAGIKIVTLQSGTEYTLESINKTQGQLFTIVGEIQRANQESERKSFLVGKAWENKRNQAIEGNKKMTSQCPNWLELSEDNTEFTINEDAQFSINLIFDRKLEGIGSEKIAKEMNQSTYWIPPGRKGKKPSWRKSYIDKLLHNDRRLLGELQLFRLIEGKREPIGEPIKDYYPTIIEQNKFDRVQAQIKRNFQLKGYAGGRNGKMNNLFSPMAICYYCDSPMQFIDKGKPPKGGQYYMCDKEKRGIDGGCISKLFRYDKIEENILTYCKGLDVTDIMPKEEAFISKLAKFHDQQQAIEGELGELEKTINSYYDFIKSLNKSAKEAFAHRIHADLAKQEKLIQEKKVIIDRIEQMNNDGKNTQEQLKNIQELIEKMKTMDDQQRLEIRINLRNHLRRLIKRIRITRNSIHMLFYTGASRGIHFREDGSIFIQNALRNTRKKYN